MDHSFISPAPVNRSGGHSGSGFGIKRAGSEIEFPITPKRPRVSEFVRSGSLQRTPSTDSLLRSSTSQLDRFIREPTPRGITFDINDPNAQSTPRSPMGSRVASRTPSRAASPQPRAMRGLPRRRSSSRVDTNSVNDSAFSVHARKPENLPLPVKRHPTLMRRHEDGRLTRIPNIPSLRTVPNMMAAPFSGYTHLATSPITGFEIAYSKPIPVAVTVPVEASVGGVAVARQESGDASATTDGPRGGNLFACTPTNVLFFTRGHSVYSNTISTNIDGPPIKLSDLTGSQSSQYTESEDVDAPTDPTSEFCTFKSKSTGIVRCIEAERTGFYSQIAFGTARGKVVVRDVESKKTILAFNNKKDLTAISWRTNFIAIGSHSGTVRLYDVRVGAKEIQKMVNDAYADNRKMRVHCVPITQLAWNKDGGMLASGDERGIVRCWDVAQGNGTVLPMDIGEMAGGVKKIHHGGRITGIAWAPWSAKTLATGDSAGVLRTWDLSSKRASNGANTVLTGAAITSIHWSPYDSRCREIVSTHGRAVPGDSDYNNMKTYNDTYPRLDTENSLLVHSELLQFVKSAKVNAPCGALDPTPVTPNSSQTNDPASQASQASDQSSILAGSDGIIGDAILDPTGLSLIYELPEKKVIRQWKVWGKPPQRQKPKLRQEMSQETMRGCSIR